ncbi:D-aminoacyl-tRNA deacylase [Fundidesulfovibrio agrisoli]|uniref:D-aminoacyl-tRNA deacylase n=1 Tax=Fundidesulfovibrio agrisoli TaxID=2922717 RepID=UPI001FAD4C8B|nr:D-aminoacyl-tRNA deacylase [Fundidesulfovibrio agrisoli]
MRLVVQRVSHASVDVAGERVAAIGQGFLALAGFGPDDGPDLPASQAWRAMLDKLAGLRVFSDSEGKMNLSLADTGGEVLLVSQFTLYADCRKGMRPGFSRACPPDTARALFDRLARDVEARLPGRTATGVFGADMAVSLTNQGPVTIILDSADFTRPATAGEG